jgi:hypothetical protein
MGVGGAIASGIGITPKGDAFSVLHNMDEVMWKMGVAIVFGMVGVIGVL